MAKIYRVIQIKLNQLVYENDHMITDLPHTPRLTALFRTTQVSRYQKGKTTLDFTEARDGEWQWHQLGHVQVCTLVQTDNHASPPPLSFLQAGCPSCRPTNSVKALKAASLTYQQSVFKCYHSDKHFSRVLPTRCSVL